MISGKETIEVLKTLENICKNRLSCSGCPLRDVLCRDDNDGLITLPQNYCTKDICSCSIEYRFETSIKGE